VKCDGLRAGKNALRRLEGNDMVDVELDADLLAQRMIVV
jgi:hypothetical protein